MSMTLKIYKFFLQYLNNIYFNMLKIYFIENESNDASMWAQECELVNIKPTI